ncbi:HigA family addiction module antitoxin [Paraburkholderia bannensis]|uniref:HigA family addiction module antitoxin n=1 Tax=Paraburkholderia bannensis TaxID=765414 RepID=UPI0007C5C3DC|nr:HigA family addiction module antitoxin [Paraburkholderia bannensis]
MHAPSHPGEILREDIVPGLKLTPEKAAAQLGVQLDDFVRVLSAEAPVTAELALRIEAWLGVDHGGDAEFWLRMQASHDLWHAHQRGVAAEVMPAPGCHPSTKPEALRNPQNNMSPIHPGEVLREDFMIPAGLDAATLAAELGMPSVVLDAILAERRGITFEIACRIIERFGGDVASWLALQAEYTKAKKRRWRIPSPEREAEIQRGIAEDPIDAAELSPEQMKRLRSDRDWRLEKYTYRIVWSEEDQENVGLCDEFPSLSWLEPTKENALAGIRQLVADCLDERIEDGEPLPSPISQKSKE